MLKRKIYDRFLKWKSNSNHNCLVVKGQRQVGKTFIIRYFAQNNYRNVVYLDFSVDKIIHTAFEKNLDVESIINTLKMYISPEIFIPYETIIVMDEIQSCPRARQSLKSFSIDGRYDVIASGSLLDLVEERSDAILPVGYEESITMYSLDFEEFLWARGIEESTIAQIKEDIHEQRPISEPYLYAFNSLFRDYMIVGGFPEAVSKFCESKDYTAAGAIIEKIIETARSDIRKYCIYYESLKIERCFETIPAQLSESNKRFTFSRVDNGQSRTSARRYEDCMLWIEKAGISNHCYSLRAPQSPLRLNCNMDQFRAYLSDTGMLLHMLGQKARIAIYNDDTSTNMGAVAENVVAECLLKSHLQRYYYKKSKGPDMMEIDFLTELGPELVAIEVKSGKSREAPSINKISNFHKIDRRIMFCKDNISVENGIEKYPLFAAAFILSIERPWEGPPL